MNIQDPFEELPPGQTSEWKQSSITKDQLRILVREFAATQLTGCTLERMFLEHGWELTTDNVQWLAHLIQNYVEPMVCGLPAKWPEGKWFIETIKEILAEPV